MDTYIVKIKQQNVAPYRLQILATSSIEALSIAIKTMRAVGSVVVVKEEFPTWILPFVG